MKSLITTVLLALLVVSALTAITPNEKLKGFLEKTVEGRKIEDNDKFIDYNTFSNYK